MEEAWFKEVIIAIAQDDTERLRLLLLGEPDAADYRIDGYDDFIIQAAFESFDPKKFADPDTAHYYYLHKILPFWKQDTNRINPGIISGNLIHLAVYLDAFGCIRILKEAGVDIDGFDAWGVPPIYIELAQGWESLGVGDFERFGVFDSLFEHGALALEGVGKNNENIYDLAVKRGVIQTTHRQIIHEFDSHGMTALTKAVYDLDIARVRFLLSWRADSNKADYTTWTPLHYAAKLGFLECCELLLQHGAKTDILDDEGLTAAELAQQSGFPVVTRYIKEWESQK